MYVKDLETGEIIVGSASSDGSAGQGFSAVTPNSLSSDGRYLAFESSASNLVPSDTNNVYDVFVKDLWYNTIERVSVSGGNEVNDQARLVGISDDGKSITFSTSASSIDPFGDNGSDIFIAKNGVYNLFNRPETAFLRLMALQKILPFLDENDNVKIIDSNGYNSSKGIEELQFNDQEISVQDIRDSLVANGEYQPPSLFDSAVLGSVQISFMAVTEMIL